MHITHSWTEKDHLYSEGCGITSRFDLLSLPDSLVGNQLHLFRQHFFHFQNNLDQTNKDRPSNKAPSTFRIKLSIPWLEKRKAHRTSDSDIATAAP